MGIRDRLRAIQDKAREKQAERSASNAAAAAFRLESERAMAAQREAAEAASRAAYLNEVLGDELADMDVSTPAEAKIAIKLARIRKKEIAAEKRELAAELADVREEWRNKTAGRVNMVGLGRGGGGRLVRGAVQSKRRGERMAHAGVVNEFSDRKQELDRRLITLDRLIADLERKSLER